MGDEAFHEKPALLLSVYDKIIKLYCRDSNTNLSKIIQST